MANELTDALLWTPVFRIQLPETNNVVLQETKERLLRSVLYHQKPPAASGSMGQDSSFQQHFGSHSSSNQVFVSSSNYPIHGRSKQAASMPVMQFLPKELHPTLNKLGIYTLADYLLRACAPLPRRELAAVCGLSPNIGLQLALRAELLDLPIKLNRVDHLHTKDILLFSLFGLDSLPAIKALGTLFNAQPTLEPIFITIVEAIQKTCSDYVGRRRLTKHDIGFWLKNACEVDSLIETDSPDSEESPSQIAENVIFKHLHARLSPPETLWKLTLTLGLIHARRLGCKDFSELKARSIRNLTPTDTEALDYVLEHCQSTMDAYTDPNFQPYIYEDQQWSLLKDLTPQLQPDTSQAQNQYKFHVKPCLNLAAMRHSPPLPNWLKLLNTGLQPI